MGVGCELISVAEYRGMVKVIADEIYRQNMPKARTII